MLRIICRAVVAPWPKLFQNLRASLETELTTKCPLHVVCAWIGHSALVAQQHRLQVTDQGFRRAAGERPAVQNAVQSPAATERQGKQETHKALAD